MTGMRAARARARAGAGCALARSRGRGGGPAVRSRVRGDAGPGLRRSLPPRGLGASSFPLRPGALGSLPPPQPAGRTPARGPPRLCPPRGPGRTWKLRSLPRAPWRPPAPRSRSQHRTRPLPAPSPRPATLPSLWASQAAPHFSKTVPKNARGACAFETPRGCKPAAPGFSPPRPTFCLLWPRGPCRGAVSPSPEELCPGAPTCHSKEISLQFLMFKSPP